MKIMGLTFFLTLLQVFLPFFVFSDEGVSKSNFVNPIDVVCNYPFNDTNKWVITCRVWGLLKYYHPNVTAGKFDWDQVLLDRLDRINEAETPEQVNIELMQMIRIAGEYEMKIDTTWNDSLNMNVNLCWLDKSFINDSIRQTLKNISSLITMNHWYYIRHRDGTDPSPIINEKYYDKDVVFQYEYRLLSLFRYWNVIYYFFPYKYLMDQSWDVTLSEFIPRFVTSFDILSYHKVVNLLAARLNDGHAYTSIKPAYYYPDFKYLTLIDSSTVVRNPPEGSMLERGDIILNIDGQNIRSIRDSIFPLISSSNRRFSDGAVNSVIYRKIMSSCTLNVARNQQVITLIEREKSMPVDTSYCYSIASNIFYVNLDNLTTIDIPKMIDSMKYYGRTIFDLRNYPKNFEHWNLLRYFIQTQQYCYGLATYADWSHLGAFYEDECITKCPDELWQEHDKYTGRLVVLINEATLSMAETYSMTFRILGATLVGTPTAGANGNVTSFPLPGDITVAYSGLGFYYPDGTQMQRTGIIPDIEVYPTMEDILEGRDEVLEAAITFLNSQ